MATAEQILKKKQFIKSEMDKSLSNSDELWSKAKQRLTEILNTYSYLPKEERLHPEGYIFPSAAIYQARQPKPSAMTATAATFCWNMFAINENLDQTKTAF